METTQFTIIFWLQSFFEFIWALFNKKIIVIGGIDISLINIFEFVFVIWASREFIKVLLDRRGGEV